MFRGTPVFQFDDKWWDGNGQQIEPKHLFRTVVVDKPEQMQAGKPVLFFVQEGRQRFLDSEYEMLTCRDGTTSSLIASAPTPSTPTAAQARATGTIGEHSWTHAITTCLDPRGSAA